MVRILSALLSILLFSSTYALAAPAEAPPEPTNTLGVVLFLILFIGSIVGFVVYVWWNRHEKDPAESQAVKD